MKQRKTTFVFFDMIAKSLYFNLTIHNYILSIEIKIEIEVEVGLNDFYFYVLHSK